MKKIQLPSSKPKQSNIESLKIRAGAEYTHQIEYEYFMFNKEGKTVQHFKNIDTALDEYHKIKENLRRDQEQKEYQDRALTVEATIIVYTECMLSNRLLQQRRKRPIGLSRRRPVRSCRAVAGTRRTTAKAAHLQIMERRVLMECSSCPRPRGLPSMRIR